MNTNPRPKQIELRFEIAGPNCLEPLVECVQQCFPAPRGETMAQVLNIGKEDYLLYTQWVCEKAIGDRLSWVAKNHEEEIVGFCINESMKTAPEYSRLPISVKFQPLMKLLEDLDHQYLKQPPVPIENIFHLYMLGVIPRKSGAGIAKELITLSLNLAKTSGFLVAIAEATGMASQKICCDLGFTKEVSIAYKTFDYQGTKPFSRIKQPESCVLVEKIL